MNYKKGFTLVEILVVIAIIGLLLAIAVPSIMGLSKKMKERGFDSKIVSIEQAAVNFVQDNANKIKDKYQSTDKFVCNEENKDCKYKFTISVQDLVDQGAYKSENKNSCDVTNPYDGSQCLDCALINIELDDEYKTVTAKIERPVNDKYLTKEKICPASFNYDLESANFTVTKENRS